MQLFTMISKKSLEYDEKSLFSVGPVMRSSADHTSIFDECSETSAECRKAQCVPGITMLKYSAYCLHVNYCFACSLMSPFRKWSHLLRNNYIWKCNYSLVPPSVQHSFESATVLCWLAPHPSATCIWKCHYSLVPPSV